MTHGAEARLFEWACWRLEPSLVCAPSQTVMQRIKEEQRNAGSSGTGFKYEVIGGVACPPDGGVGAMVQRMSSALARDLRAREVNDLILEMPDDLHALVRVTYVVVHYRELPRSERAAAEALNMKQGKYREQKARMIGWVEARLFTPRSPLKKAA